LTAIENEIEAAVRNQDALALDTAAGAVSFQKFLLAKLEEVSTVVAEAHNDNISAGATLNTLVTEYFSSTGGRSPTG
jgi:hypothetical protein